MWEKAVNGISFHILFLKTKFFLMEVKIKYKQQPPDITDHRSALFSLPKSQDWLKDHEDCCFLFLNKCCILICPLHFKDSFLQCYLEPSTQSFSAQFRSCLACSWSQWSVFRGKGRAVSPTSKRRKRKNTEIFQRDSANSPFSVFGIAHL